MKKVIKMILGVGIVVGSSVTMTTATEVEQTEKNSKWEKPILFKSASGELYYRDFLNGRMQITRINTKEKKTELVIVDSVVVQKDQILAVSEQILALAQEIVAGNASPSKTDSLAAKCSQLEALLEQKPPVASEESHANASALQSQPLQPDSSNIQPQPIPPLQPTQSSSLPIPPIEPSSSGSTDAKKTSGNTNVKIAGVTILSLTAAGVIYAYRDKISTLIFGNKPIEKKVDQEALILKEVQNSNTNPLLDEREAKIQEIEAILADSLLNLEKHSADENSMTSEQ